MERKRNTTSRKLTFLAFFGPAWLVMMADMDTSSVIGAAQTGALFKYGFVWVMLVLIIPLYVVQEVSGRIGVATGKGLGEIIRENYSEKTASFMALPMALTDAVTYAIEYIGIGVGLEVIGIPLLVSIPIIYLIHILIVTKRKYIAAEKIMLAVSFILILGLMATLVMRGIKPYSPFYISSSPNYIFLLAAVIGAVVMPFMLFFQASATAIKMGELKVNCKETALRHMRLETLIGAIVTEALMAIVEMAFAGINNVDPSTFASAQALSQVLEPVAGTYSSLVFGLGLIGAGFLALMVISLGSGWGVAEALGIKQRGFWKIYVIESLPAVIATLLLSTSSLIGIVLDLLVLFVFTLIGPILILGFISRNRRIMGDMYSHGLQEIVYWTSAIVLVAIAVLAVF
ncbi:hypothetical protein CM19_03385 [Candidatus Acidianus copahuensis]|uniref:Manganese transporter n=1 Tax=Candidatus Acidianus copahuensis TaxID=1160895 RepID=A0A031LTQ4_9CREN|nr:divalent metal cation transporter [Candidatus Acidianus copahuensis]EZQ10884.1 hypothetical protein CM19_03385 [Candidatus Acidianus copahuensis]